MGNVCRVQSVAPIGYEGHLVEVESDITKGLPSLQVVGLASKAIDEAKERIKSAITNSLLEYPARRMTINLAPAELPKDGTLYDLPMALALLGSSGQLKQSELQDAIFAGELALDGRIRPIQGSITIAETAKERGVSTVYIPSENTAQATLIPGIVVIGVHTLKELYLHLKGEVHLPSTPYTPSAARPSAPASLLDDIRGQEQAKRALIIAAAGHHNILLSGPPGSGKTLLAKTLASLLPELTDEECLEVTKIHSLAGLTVDSVVKDRPYRAPHHTASQVSLVGGGTRPKPGEISLAHRGVLFLDELPEYSRRVLEALRQPLEDKYVTVTRANGHATYPADFMLIGTMNPCPCGYYGDPAHECTCTSTQILAYQKKLSGPLLDRIDLFVTVGRVPNADLLAHSQLTHLQHSNAQKDILKSQHIQHNRYKSGKKSNSLLTSSDIKTYIPLPTDARQLLDAATTRMNLTARSYFKIIKVARTIADLDDAENVNAAHIAEALQYRQFS